MRAEVVVGLTLVAGLVMFLVGAVGWRLEYERPMRESLPVIHADRWRRAWIHRWMLTAMFVTSAGLAGYVVVPGHRGASTALAVMAATVYAIGAMCWIVSLAFRLTVVPWAADHMVEHGNPPAGFAALDRWAGSLYVAHMASAYAAFALLGAAVLSAEVLAAWAGWLGIGWGLAFLAGIGTTRFSGPFNPPFLAHTYTAVVGVLLLAT